MRSTFVALFSLVAICPHSIGQDSIDLSFEEDGAFALIKVIEEQYDSYISELENAQDGDLSAYYLTLIKPLEEESNRVNAEAIQFGIGRPTPGSEQHMALLCASFSTAVALGSEDREQSQKRAKLFIQHALDKSAYKQKAAVFIEENELSMNAESIKAIEEEAAILLNRQQLFAVHNIQIMMMIELIDDPKNLAMTAEACDLHYGRIQDYLSVNKKSYD